MIKISSYEDKDLYFHHARNIAPDSGIVPTRVNKARVYNSFGLYGFISGSAKYVIEGTTYIMKPGCILLIRPSEIHKISVTPGTMYERILINFTPELIKPIDPGLKLLNAYNDRSLGQLNLYKPGDLKIDTMQHILNMCTPGLKDEDRRLSVIANLIPLLYQVQFSFLDKKQNLHGDDRRETVFAIIAYINDNISLPLSLELLSKQFFLSKSQITRIFKSATGSSVAEYIILKRLTMAKSLLQNGKTALYASKACGFPEYSTFYRAYKKHFGSSPSDISKIKLH